MCVCCMIVSYSVLSFKLKILAVQKQKLRLLALSVHQALHICVRAADSSPVFYCIAFGHGRCVATEYVLGYQSFHACADCCLDHTNKYMLAKTYIGVLRVG